MADARTAYTRSGVNVVAGERAVDLMRSAVESTRRREVLSGIGGFASVVALPAGMREPVLVSSTDGVGTKTAIATQLNRFDTIGQDLVAMCADDVVCAGAEPLFFLDYVAVEQLVPESVAELVGSIARGCILAGCSLVGGETAEHPGLMHPDTFDLAGCCVGVVERDQLIDGSGVRAGDAIIGIGSNGLHANGFSLIRALLAQHDMDLWAPYQEVLQHSLGDAGREVLLRAEPDHELATLGEVLLTPARIYARAVLAIRASLRRTATDIRAIAHITGGGLPGNVPRVLPEDLGALVNIGTWTMPSVMTLFGALGGIEADELRATFNGGIGMVLVVPAPVASRVADELAGLGMPAWRIGEVRPTAELDGRRYVETLGERA